MGRHAAERPSRGARRAVPTRRRPPVKTVLVAALLLGAGSTGTYAYWNDTATVTGGELQSGSMDLQVDGGAVGTGTNVTVGSIATSDLTPTEYQAFDLSLANVGTPDFTWTARAQRGSTWTYVGDPLTVQLFEGSAVDDPTYPRLDTCHGPALGVEQTLSTAGEALTVTSVTLVAGGTAPVCVRIGMKADADNTNQGKAGTVELRFEATQVTG